jgi:DNA (cytosine-5)-methyltransferase 1
MTGARVLDLFCGAGGLSSGFAQAGFRVTGVDCLESVPQIYEKNRLGETRVLNLHHQTVNGGYDVVVGGPPCRPWSSVNLVKRGSAHRSFRYLARFVSHVVSNRPEFFLMENVPPARVDAQRVAARLAEEGYDTRLDVIRYSDFGAATSRRRLILWGTKSGNSEQFVEALNHFRRPASTVRDAIFQLDGVKRGAMPDHDYPDFQTIENYVDRYESGQYGWYRLRWDQTAPSFGNVMKTYTLHPSSWEGSPARVISVKEALLLMGFDRDYGFPPGMGIAQRYQMVADSVSPVFSYAVARAIATLL